MDAAEAERCRRLPSQGRARQDRGAGAGGTSSPRRCPFRDLRKAIGKTQAAIAKRLKVGQDGVSKPETRSDMTLSTLRGVLQAMGGDLELVARFPDRPPVRLEDLAAPAPRRNRARRAAA